jgi:SAM-dependent methyltransferase
MPQTSEYLLDTGSDLGREQLDHLAYLFDPVSTRFIDEIGVEAGQRCLDVGAGGGSIARWLAERTGPSGTVVAVDIDTSRLRPDQGVEIHRHDINDGLPVAGPFDLIHARFVLMHLSRRTEIVTTLVDALAPGGWLVIGDFSDRPRHVLSAPDPASADLFDRVQCIGHAMTARLGSTLEWAQQAPHRLARAGLTNIHAGEHTTTTAGGTAGCLLHRNYARQIAPRLLAEGLTDEELTRYQDLMLDPRFRGWFYQFVQTRGQAAPAL